MTKRELLGFTLYHLFRPFVKLPNFLSIYFHNPHPIAFEKSIKWALDNGYRFTTIDEFLPYLKGERNTDRKLAIVTFDDAWRSNLKLIPIIEKYNIPVTIFAPVEPLASGNYWWEYAQTKGGYALSNKMKTLDELTFKKEVDKLKNEIQLERSAMTTDELVEISRNPLVDIECHSYNHPILTNLSDDSLKYEYIDSKNYLSTLLHKEINYFCYPNGSLSEREVSMAKRYYKAAFSTIQDKPKVCADLYRIPRYALNNDYWVNLSMMIGVWKWFVKY